MASRRLHNVIKLAAGLPAESGLFAVPSAASPATPRAPIGWLIQLRWVAVAGQLVTVLAAVAGYKIDLPLPRLLLAIGVTGLSNLGLQAWAGRRAGSGAASADDRAEAIALGVLAFDLGILTQLLYWSGGPTNPFVLFYFVNLVVCGVMLSRQRAWMLYAFFALCFLALCLRYRPIPELRDPRSLRGILENGGATIAQQGLLASFLLCTGVIVHFVTKLTAAIRLQEKQLHEAELKRAGARRWEALGALAAGAAHELATPLSAIAVASAELEHLRDLQTERRAVPDPCGGQQEDGGAEEYDVIRQSLARCRAILNRMSLQAGRLTLEETEPIPVEDLAAELRESFVAAPTRVHVELNRQEAPGVLRGPRESLCQALRSFVQNAIDASPPGRMVHVTLRTEADHVLLIVADQGVGMSPEVLEHADEPFFTTKEAGEGMGMGRYLARQVIRQFGGELETESTLGVGTTVRVRLPLERELSDS